MARIGLSRPFYAIYSYNEEQNKVTYSGGKRFAKAVSTTIEPEANDPSNFYADNGVAESSAAFSGGSVSISVDELEPEHEAALLGATISEDKTEVTYGADDAAPYVGYGVIVKRQYKGQPRYQGIVLRKVVFHAANEEHNTQGESIEFSGDDLEGIILRADDDGGWLKKKLCDDEAAAETWIKGELNITT